MPILDKLSIIFKAWSLFEEGIILKLAGIIPVPSFATFKTEVLSWLEKASKGVIDVFSYDSLC